MADVADIRLAIKTRLATINGLNVYDVMPMKPELPGAAVALRSGAFDQDMDGSTLFRFYIWIYGSGADLERSQRRLDAYLTASGATSIKEAVEDDQSLGGIADWVRVTGWSQPPTAVPEYGSQVLAVPLDCEVMA